MDEHRLRASDAERDQILNALRQAYGAGRLDLNDLRQREEQALQVCYIDELPALVADLPVSRELMLSTEHPVAQRPMLDARRPRGGMTLTVMSARDVLVTAGTAEVRNFAWWGGNSYDLSEAMGPGRTVVLRLHAVMAGSDVLVPPGVRVVDRCVAFMAGNQVEPEAQGDGFNGTLILQGFLWWGGHQVKLAPRFRPHAGDAEPGEPPHPPVT
ncbi:hypothetical protein BW730_16655 [Tessaracoccus aquimaris]|uniref:DUF1707 domain-containing protein n=1 Tax=Tessaracoccus aquimaris TaxID=1332264 RepID=A0A1Q2CS98_9ACTN|nr:DUF1707 domain-containing protein [Tessaracoccus aquimaris]AQP48880.1 hypothetical protein BW730_16655 [Tessaracoccus aquimaris]